jgi:hypothetical protein
LYGDDLSSTGIGLQRVINRKQEFCKELKLKRNVGKGKVVEWRVGAGNRGNN